MVFIYNIHRPVMGMLAVHLTGLCLLVTWCPAMACTDEDDQTSAVLASVGFVPPEVFKVDTGDRFNVVFHLNGTLPPGSLIRIISNDEKVAIVVNGTHDLGDECVSWCSVSIPFAVKGKRVGRTTLSAYVKYWVRCGDNAARPVDTPLQGTTEHFQEEELVSGYLVGVWRKRGAIIRVYLLTTAIFLVLLTFGLGCQLDFNIFMQIGKKPIPPLIGFVCQFVVLPLIGFGLSKALRLPPEFGFGVLVYSCSPGGGTSSVFANILDGDVTLSLIMTILSTLLSLGMVPLWMKLLSGFYVDPTVVVIPYLEIVKALLLLTIPCIFGILVQRFIPKFSRFIIRINKYFACAFVAFQIIACASVNPYMFSVIYAYPIILVVLLFLPVCGFAAGYLISYACRQPHYRALTIALETSVQNNGIPIIMLMYAFPQPDGDLAATFPLASGYATGPPIIIVFIIYKLYKWRRKDKEDSGDESDDVTEHPAHSDVIYRSLNDITGSSEREGKEKETELSV